MQAAFSLFPSFLKSNGPINARETFIADVYQYFVNIIERVSKENGLGELWAETKPQIQKELNEWKKGRHMAEFSQFVYVLIRLKYII